MLPPGLMNYSTLLLSSPGEAQHEFASLNEMLADEQVQAFLKAKSPSKETIEKLLAFNDFHCSGCFVSSIAPTLFISKRLKRCGTICVKNIFNIPHVLVVRGKRSKIWSLPKGCINEGESEQQCAERETLEETGIHVEIKPENVKININHNVYFLLQMNYNPKLRIRDRGEVDKVNWMTLSEIRGLDCNKDLRSILQYPHRKFSFHYHLVDILRLNEIVE
jgi:ADP-ribose pyrophosphatase YjhB (NUDIX family)